jgi:triacylglycerol esterase/lipase EstA (alpha/beta hydrolase family)
MTKNIFAIHGAYATPATFNYLKYKLGKGYKWTFLDYRNVSCGVQNIVNNVENLDEPYHVIGHSMGGLIGLKLLERPWVKSLTTISSPINGIELTWFQQYLTKDSFLPEITEYSEFIRNLKLTDNIKPIQHIVSMTGYSPFMWKPNDGVITIWSQIQKSQGPIHEVKANHIEIMLIDETRQLLTDFWKNIDSETI